MCGFSSFFSYGPNGTPVTHELIHAMGEPMAARGPDGQGIWLSEDGRIGLGHRRLSIIDLSESGAQPMVGPSGRTRISYNGEIYNYQALRQEVLDAGIVLKSHSDTEVLLALYEKDGPAFVSKLRGMFAFALWDEDRQGMLLARDPFGIKPLYVFDDGQRLVAASQVQAIKAAGLPLSDDPAGWAGFYLWGAVPEPFTTYREIKALPAGSTLWLDKAGKREEKRFFDLRAEMVQAEETARTRPSPWMHEALRVALTDSLKHHLIADVEVSCFLSGGLDSTTLLGLATEAAGAPVRAVTLGFEEFRDDPRDEVPLAQLTAQHYGAPHDVDQISAQDFLAERSTILAAMDQPTVDGVNVYFVSRAARRAGLKVALSGLGGDELFGGYNTFTDVPAWRDKYGRLARLPGLGKTLSKSLRWMSAPLLSKLAGPKAAGLLELTEDTGQAYLLRRGLFLPWELPKLMGAEDAREGWQRLKLVSRLRATTEGLRSDRLRLSALETSWYMRQQLLRDADWAGMANSLEIRTPLVDIDLFRACLPWLCSEVPPSKLDMAASPSKPLPEAILNKPKTGFFVPVAEWMQADQGGADKTLRGWANHVAKVKAGPAQP